MTICCPGCRSYSFTNPQLYVQDNTGRFGVLRIMDTVFPLGETDRARMGYEFPYWEKAAQLTEDRLFYDYVIVFAGIILLLIGLVMTGLKIRAGRNTDQDGDERREAEIRTPKIDNALIFMQDNDQ